MKKNNPFALFQASILVLLICLMNSLTLAQNVEIKDASNNILMRVEDEGTTGSIYLTPGTMPPAFTHKLYNVGGVLNFNGTSLGAPLWSQNGYHIYYNDGKVGIGATTPLATLHVNGIHGALFTGTYDSGVIPVEGPGTRMMWYPGKAAFRAGHAANDQWNDANIGTYSAAFGKSTKAIGAYSFATGFETEASGAYSFACGNSSSATATNSVAFGEEAVSSGLFSVSFGGLVQAIGSYSFTLGYGMTSSGFHSFAFGRNGTVSGDYSILLGMTDMNLMNLTQDHTMAIMGGNVGIGILDPLRRLEVVDDINSYVTMIKNTTTTDADGLRIVLQVTTPVSGNRFVDFMRSGGSAYAGYICGDGLGGVSYVNLSDERLKRNIRDYSGGLQAVSKIQVRQYEMKSAPGKEQVGFIAQELINIFPQAVSGDPSGNVEEDPMGIDYGRITPLLVAAIQEQQEMIGKQQKLIEGLREEIDILKSELAEH